MADNSLNKVSYDFNSVSKKRILVHVHLFYLEMWQEIQSCLKNLDKLHLKWDLYVTLVDKDECNHIIKIKEIIQAFKPDAVVLTVANRGYDVGPFIEILNHVDLHNYDLVFKLHSKRNVNPLTTLGNFYDVSGPKWRVFLLSFICSQDKLKKLLKAFSTDPSLGMAASYNLIIPFRKHGKYNEWVMQQCYKLFKQLNINPRPEKKFKYVAGTMFAIRTEILQKIKELKLDINSFSTPDRKNERDLAHVLERFMGWIVTSISAIENNIPTKNDSEVFFKIKDEFTCPFKRYTDFPAYISRHHLLVHILRFILRREYDSNQKLIRIKVLKIPLIKYKIHKP